MISTISESTAQTLITDRTDDYIKKKVSLCTIPFLFESISPKQLTGTDVISLTKVPVNRGEPLSEGCGFRKGETKKLYKVVVMVL